MALSDLVRKKKKTASAKELIEQAMRQGIEEKLPMLADDWFRISSFGEMCPREEVLRNRFDVPVTRGIGPDLGLVFEFGHSIHWIMQNKVMAATGHIVGMWRCTWCGETYGGKELVARPEVCLRCGAFPGGLDRVKNKPVASGRPEAFLFMEQWVGNHEYMIGGSPDGFFVDGDPLDFKDEDVVVLEFKSASDANYVKYQKAPDFMHVIQCQCYMWITGYSRAKILYVNKGKFGMEGIMEHDVAYDPETIEMVKTGITQVRRGLIGGPVPPRQMCASESCPRATACVVSKQCFHGGL